MGALANERIESLAARRIGRKAGHAQPVANIEPIAGGRCAQIRKVTRPSRSRGVAYDSGANRIVVDVGDQSGGAIAMHRNRTRARSEDGSQSICLSVQPTGETNMNALRETLERASASDHDEVDVRAHQRVGQQSPIRMFESAS